MATEAATIENKANPAAPTVENSTTFPDDGKPNKMKEVSSNTNSSPFNENGRENSRGNFRRSGRLGFNNERNPGSFRRSFPGNEKESEFRGPHGGHKRDYPPPDRKKERDYHMHEYGGRGRDFGGNRQEHGNWNPSDFIREKLFEISGPTHELPSLDMKEKKFNGRNRLYVGNIGAENTEEELRKMFSKYGEINDIFMNREKYFAFIVFDYHCNAVKAKQELDGIQMANDRQLKIRWSPRAATLKVSNLPATVTNELLFHAFSVFGDIERAIVLTDERGRSTGVGEIDFERKKSAMHALKECTDGCFFLTNSLRPCIVELSEPNLDTEGFSEKSIPWKSSEYLKDREVGPWLAKPNSFEFEFGTKWKQIRELYKQKEESLKKDLQIEEDKLYAQMGFVKYEYETEMLKKQLEERQMYWEQQKQELEKKERMADELRLRNEEDMRRREEQIKAQLLRHEEELKLRSKESPFHQHDRRRLEGWNELPNTDDRYWQQELQNPPDDVVSQGSRERSSFLEEPGQVWRRLDQELDVSNEELFQRRTSNIAENAAIEEDYRSSGQWKRSWDDPYDFGKRGRF